MAELFRKTNRGFNNKSNNNKIHARKYNQRIQITFCASNQKERKQIAPRKKRIV